MFSTRNKIKKYIYRTLKFKQSDWMMGEVSLET